VKDGFLYGTFGFDTITPFNDLRCVEMRTARSSGPAPGFGRGGILMVDTNLMVLTEKCELVLATVNTNSYQELGRFLAMPRSTPTTTNAGTFPPSPTAKFICGALRMARLMTFRCHRNLV
jgi:hypothetical protein